MSDTYEGREPIDLSPIPQVNLLLNDIVRRLQAQTPIESTHDIVERVKDYAESQVNNLNKLAAIGVALSSVRNLDQLLEMILDQARAFTHCDGGTLYLVGDDESSLHYSIMQNQSLNTRKGGTSGDKITFPPIPLSIDGEPNNSNVCAYVASSGKMVNIPDVYEVEGFDFQGPRKFDLQTGYRTRSMLVFPMRDHEGEIIGVMQLINALDRTTGDRVTFSPELEDLSAALASQAAVAITNVRLIRDLENLFDALIKTIAAAIDEKSAYTGGHIERVSNLTMEIARRIDADTEGPYKDVHFTDDEMYELRLAAWLHDTGKITTPEYVVDKKTKLETIFDREELVRTRFELAMAKKMLKATNGGADVAPDTEDGSGGEIERLRDDLNFIIASNFTAEFVPDEKIERLQGIAEQNVETSIGPESLLTDNELYNLSIRKGNLTPEERKVIENHALVTIKMLEKLPFPKKIRNVPSIAGAHHEKLNGRGYPLGLKGGEIVLQARIMALADIFEALTAKDRPYKSAKKMSEVLKILGFMVKDNELDAALVQFFIDQRMHIEYGKQHLEPFQIDVE